MFRVNCIDCLDRTNVVQTALGKAVLESQLVKLGLAPPYSHLPDELKTPFMIVWANNGDCISKQYAGKFIFLIFLADFVSKKPKFI